MSEQLLVVGVDGFPARYPALTVAVAEVPA